MEKLYHNLDIIILSLVVVFLLVFFLRLLGKKKGFQRSDYELRQKELRDKIIMSVQERIKESNSAVKPVTIEYPEGSLNHKINQLMQKLPSFNYKNFIKAAKENFTKILEGVGANNLESVQNLLDGKIYQNLQTFLSNLAESSSGSYKNIKVESFMICDIEDIKLPNTQEMNSPKTPQVLVKFNTRQNRNNQVMDFQEVWTFTLREEPGKIEGNAPKSAPQAWVVSSIQPQ